MKYFSTLLWAVAAVCYLKGFAIDWTTGHQARAIAFLACACLTWIGFLWNLRGSLRRFLIRRRDRAMLRGLSLGLCLKCFHGRDHHFKQGCQVVIQTPGGESRAPCPCMTFRE